MQSSPSHTYSQSVDKQRILVVGKSKARITEMILFVLRDYHRKFDFTTPASESFSDAPIVIIESNDLSPDIITYQPHIVILSNMPADGKDTYSQLADSVSKCGVIIYDETDSKVKEIASKERPDVSTIPYSVYKHESQASKATLITSTKEKISIQLTAVEDLKNISAAKELLKKVGISSGQFYRTIASFK
jgi:UDP-N-acetylmuramate: L-alanyl-gamma-D-glutamyl-meso-diaminopimelate ligase